MKIWHELVHCVREIGLKGTAELVIGRLEDYVFDIRYGTDTMRPVALGDLDVASENKSSAEAYQATRSRHFNKLMQCLDLPARSVFVDFGSGKGRVLMLASRYDFKKVVGVEFSPKLCRIARRNVSVYRQKVRGTAHIEIYEGDAADYVIEDDENVFFFFRPFDVQVMSRVLGNIAASLERRHRKIWLINHEHLAIRPGVYRDLLEGQDSVFARSTQFVSSGYVSIVYVNDVSAGEEFCSG